MDKKLYRSKTNKMLAGVCAGVADYAGMDPTVVRLLWVLASLVAWPVGVIGYIAAMIIVPEEA